REGSGCVTGYYSGRTCQGSTAHTCPCCLTPCFPDRAGKENPMTLGELVDQVRIYHPEADANLIARAYDFSERMHQGQKRLSGEPYFVHPVEVAKIITTM